MLLNKSYYNIKSNNYFESFNDFEGPTKCLDIMSHRTLAVPHRQRKSKDYLNNISVDCQNRYKYHVR